jgi:transcriptional regulator with XRE-family HTH domain
MPEDPTGPRLQFAAELKAARERAGLSTDHVARKLKCTPATIRRWERGGSGLPRFSDLGVMLDMYGITDSAQRAMFTELHEQADQGLWWSRFRVADVMSQLLGFEAIANEIWIYERSLITGLLQTRAYARAVMAALEPGLDAAAIEQGAQLRALRQARVLKSQRPPKLRVLLDEDAVRRPAAPPEVMREQLAYLYRGPYPYELRVLPRDAGAHPGSLGSFYAYHFPGRMRKAAAYSDGPLRHLYSDDPEDVGLATAKFERMWKLALSRAQSLELIHTTIEELRKT